MQQCNRQGYRTIHSWISCIVGERILLLLSQLLTLGSESIADNDVNYHGVCLNLKGSVIWLSWKVELIMTYFSRQRSYTESDH